MCCSADPSNFLKAVKNPNFNRSNFFQAVEAHVHPPFSLFCPIPLSFTVLCPLLRPFLFDCQAVNSAWRVSGMYRIPPSWHGLRWAFSLLWSVDPLAASSRWPWGQKGWKLSTMELQHLLLQNCESLVDLGKVCVLCQCPRQNVYLSSLHGEISK